MDDLRVISETKEVAGLGQIADEVYAALSPDSPKEVLDILREVRQRWHDRALSLARSAPGEVEAPSGFEYVGTVIEVDRDDINAKIHYDLVFDAIRQLVRQNRAKEAYPDQYIRI